MSREPKEESMPLRIRMSPELGDGQHASYVSADAEGRQIALAAVRTFLDEFADEYAAPAHCAVEVVEMSDEQFEALPDL